MIRIGVMGERDGGFAPHYGLESAVQHSASRLSLAVELTWIGTSAILADPATALVGHAGLWAAPGNLASVAGALAGIRFTVDHAVPERRRAARLFAGG